MTALNLDTILRLAQEELELLRRRYGEVVAGSPPTLSMLASFLGTREAGTILAIERYRIRNEHSLALDVHVRLGGGFPLCDAPPWPQQVDVDTLLELAQDSDSAIGELRERIELYAAGAEVHTALNALVSLSHGRQRQLTAATHELRGMRL